MSTITTTQVENPLDLVISEVLIECNYRGVRFLLIIRMQPVC
jgi:hypothetical protein